MVWSLPDANYAVSFSTLWSCLFLTWCSVVAYKVQHCGLSILFGYLVAKVRQCSDKYDRCVCMVWYGAAWRGMLCHGMSCQSKRPELIPTTSTDSPFLESLVEKSGWFTFFQSGWPGAFPRDVLSFVTSFSSLAFPLWEGERKKERKSKWKSWRKEVFSFQLTLGLNEKEQSGPFM